MPNEHFATRIIQVSENAPLHRTAGYVLGEANRAASLYAWQDPEGNVYSRISNPTVRAMEQALAGLEGGAAAVATSSGQAAVFLALEALLQPGLNFIASNKLYGGTAGLFTGPFAKFGFHARWADPGDPASFAAQIDDDTRALFVETVANPDGTIPDFEGLAALAREKRLPLIVDNTLASPCLFRPLEHGAHIVVHSTTKFINGHATAIGGIVVDSGKFPWKDDPRYPALSAPTPNGDAPLAERFDAIAYAVLIRQSLAVFGACQSPDNAALTLNGLRTLPLRIARHTSNAQTVAEFLASHPAISDVRYPGLVGNPNNARAKKYLSQGAGAVILFTLRDGRPAAERTLHNLRLFTHKANIGETGSLALHPETTTHNQCSEEQKEAAGIFPGTLRLAIGLEDPGDLVRDLAQALPSATKGA